MKTRTGFMRGLRRDRGASLVEFVLVVPVLFLLILNAVNFGGFFYAWITVADAARAAANYAILGGASAGSLTLASGTQINSVITQDISSLAASNPALIVDICTNANGTITTVYTSGGSCTSTNTPADPEPSNYTLTSVVVSYSYTPLISSSAFRFPRLGIYLTIPPATITRTVMMRSIQ
jgi:Flp pilus assembly protein TadG